MIRAGPQWKHNVHQTNCAEVWSVRSRQCSGPEYSAWWSWWWSDCSSPQFTGQERLVLSENLYKGNCEDTLRDLNLQQHVLIPQATPREVWEFMADFSNYKLLNPHLIHWHVLSDSAHKKKQVDFFLDIFMSISCFSYLSIRFLNPCDVGFNLAVHREIH